MVDWLTGNSSKLEVLSVIGMAGIGKTTFTKRLYDNPLTTHHFYVRARITVSQQYREKEMLLGILRCAISSLLKEMYERSSDELREQVYKILKGKRYFIVLDDMWDKEAWDDLRMSFPDDKNGSRVVLTSRLRDVAVHACRYIPPHCLQFLSTDESWELLCSKISGNNESCPPELVKIGKQIAQKCQGLPLGVVVVGGILSKTNNKLLDWERVAQQVRSLVMKAADDCEKMISLSYNHLPCHLKACFLYMGIFPEDYDISAKKLIRLWVAEGFVSPSIFNSLEEVAEDYLEELVDRSLTLVKGRRPDGRIKICGIHDLMREFCLRESQKECFFRVIKSDQQITRRDQHDIDNRPWEQMMGLIKTIGQIPSVKHNNAELSLRRLSFHSSIIKYMRSEISFPFTSSLFCFETLRSTDLKRLREIDIRSLKVVDMLPAQLILSDKQNYLHKRVKFCMRYVAVLAEYFADISRSLPLLHQVQTLVVDCEWDGYLSPEFWNMCELRHLEMKRSNQSNQARKFIGNSSSISASKAVLTNLQSLSRIRPSSCTREVFVSIPNLTSLAILEIEEDFHFRGWFGNLKFLKKLEALKYVFSNPFVSPHLRPGRLPPETFFPPKLKKLSLRGTSFPWEDMVKISLLPKLEVLKLSNYAFSGKLWKTSEGGFGLLRFLLIGSTDLEVWETDGSHFPTLQHLV